MGKEVKGELSEEGLVNNVCKSIEKCRRNSRQ